MTPRFILITTAAILLAGCDRPSAQLDAAKAAEMAAQRQAEQAANDKVRQLEERLNAADQLKASEREAELARVKEELAQVKRDKDAVTERIRDLQNEADKPAPPPIAEAPAREPQRDREPVREPFRETADPRGAAIHADLERTVEEEEDREPVYVGRVVPETQRVANVESFYEPLDEYGDWIQTDDYGYVFRPEAAHRHDWRPYTDGHWVHSGHGWTWQSNEGFGWATYHYGRWAREERAGWVWVPGREWGPGWVSWRRGNEECGWAPLPPESRGRHSFTATVDRDYDIGPAAYVFIALSNFGARSYAPVIERPERNVAIINQTVNVTNITYNNTTNNTVVYNGGPSYELLRARSKQPVENVQVNFTPQAPAGDRRKIVNLRQGDTLQVAPPPAAVAANTVPARVKEKLGKPKEDKGWAGVDPAQAQKVKQEIAATSTERPRRPRPAAAVVNPALPVVAVPPTAPARPVRPVVVAPEAAKPLPVMPRPEQPARPPVVEKPRLLDPDAATPRPVIGAPPKVDPPDEPKKIAAPEPPKMREPEPAHPKAAPEISPKLDEPKTPAPMEPAAPRRPADHRIPRLGNEPPPKETPEPNPNGDLSERAKRAGESEPRRFNPDGNKATPKPESDAPKRRVVQPTPVVRERPQPVVPREAPVRVKPQPEAPARVRQVVPERPVSAPEPAPRRQAAPAPAPERPAQVARPVEQPVRRIVQPQRPPQEMRAPEPRVNRPAPQPVVERAPERVQRPPAPVVQRQPQPPVVQRPPQQPVVQRQPQVIPQARPPQKAEEESDKRKKKKEGEQ